MNLKRFIIIPEVEDIKFFMNFKNSRDYNYKSNEMRENIIGCIHHIYENYYECYYEDPIYGKNWVDLKNKLDNAIMKTTKIKYDNYKLIHKGGMNYNYDFILKFLSNDKIVEELPLEFKYNNSKLSDLPQFLELYDKDIKNKYDLCSISYAEFYYDNYLDKYLKIDKKITEIKPNKEIYLENVFDIKYKHTFFENMHKNKNNFIKEKRNLAAESITEYINKYCNSFNFEKLTEKIKKSQINKIFLLWNNDDFHVEKINVENIKIIGIIEKNVKSIKNLYFDVNVENFIYNIRIRINWGNSGGLCNPRWKFTFIYK